MPRIARVVVSGLPYHVTQRGNYGQPVFDDDEDRKRCFDWLRPYSHSSGLSIWAYCLMTNHVHFVAVPAAGKEDALARTFNRLHMRYAQYLNGRRKRRGHLWQGRFYSCPLDDPHLYEAVKYVERNPVRARIVARPIDYEWSSARAHVMRVPDSVLSPGCPLETGITNWADYISLSDDELAMRELRSATRTGRPAGDESFILRLGALVGRKLTAAPRGRPRTRQRDVKESGGGNQSLSLSSLVAPEVGTPGCTETGTPSGSP